MHSRRSLGEDDGRHVDAPAGIANAVLLAALTWMLGIAAIVYLEAAA